MTTGNSGRDIRIRLCGMGGQGVLLCAMVLGRAAAIGERKHAALSRSFGPEVRGTLCTAQLILSVKPVRYPYFSEPDVLIAFSQTAYLACLPREPGRCLVLTEKDLVKPVRNIPPAHRIPALRMAEAIGSAQSMNIVMAGFFTACTQILTPQSCRTAVETSVPAGSEKLNIRAFNEGYWYGNGAPKMKKAR